MTLRTLRSVVLPVEKQDPVSSGRRTIRYIDIGAIDRGRIGALDPITADSAPTRARQIVKAGDTVFSTVRPYLRKIARVPLDLDGEFASTGFCVLRPNAEIDSRYLFHLLNSDVALGQILPLQRGVSYPAVRDRDVLAVEVDLPALGEQQRLVDILDDHLSRLDAAEAEAQRAVVRTDSLKRAAAFRGLLGESADQYSRLSRAITEDSGLPHLSNRTWGRLGELAEVVGGVTKDSKRQDLSMVEVPYLRVANVQRMRLDLSTIMTIRVPAAKANALRLQPGDVLLNEGGDRDKLARGWVWEGQIAECIHQNHVYRARPDTTRVLPEWVAWSANYLGGEWAARHGRQSVNLASISLSTIKRMPIPLVNLTEQRRLLEELTNVSGGATRLVAQAATLTARSASLRRALRSAAFSGQLTGRAIDADRIEELADASYDFR